MQAMFAIPIFENKPETLEYFLKEKSESIFFLQKSA